MLCKNVFKLVEEDPVVEPPPIAETRLWKSDCRLLKAVVCVEVVPLLDVALPVVLLLFPSACIMLSIEVAMGEEYAVLLFVPFVPFDWSCVAAKRSCMNLCRAFWAVDVLLAELVLVELSVPLAVDDESMLKPI